MKKRRAPRIRKSGRKPSVTKRYIKFLEVAKSPPAIKAVIKSSPDQVIKGLCNIALNASEGDVHLNPKQKKLLSNNRKLIGKLIDKKKSIKFKRGLLNQKGNGFFIPLLISSVLGSLGSALFQQQE